MNLIKVVLLTCFMFFMGYLLMAEPLTKFTPGCPFDAGGGNMDVPGTANITSNATIGGFTQLYSRSTAQLNAITPTVVGQVYWNSSTNEFYVSTGTAVNQFIHK